MEERAEQMIAVKADTELGELVAATSKEHPTPAQRQALEDYLAQQGHAELARIGNLATQVQTSIIARNFPQYSIGLAVAHHCADMFKELDYDDASAMERMLIENIVLCWLRLHEREFRLESIMAKNPSFSDVEYYERRISDAQRRFLRSVETLARVRRLMKDPPNPAFNLLLKQQLNIHK